MPLWQHGRIDTHHVSSQVSGSLRLPWERRSVFIRTPLIGTEDYVPTVPQPSYFVVGPVTDDLYFLIVSSNQATSSVSTYVPILDGTNYREWSAQMRAYLRSVGFWLIVNGTTTAPMDPVELQKWTLSDLMANGAIEL